jgi:kojibiose phosphorylase
MFKRDLFSEEVASYLSEDEWLVIEDGYDAQKNLAYESIFGLASGYMGNRASHEEGDVRSSLPANYIHGVFDKSEAFQRELCNTPDWTKLKMYYKRDPIGIESGQSLDEYIRVLDMKKGFLAKHYVTTAHDGRKTKVELIKFLSRGHNNLGLLRIYLTPINYQGLFEFENIIDASVTNFMDFPRFRVKHLETLEVEPIDEFGASILSQTRDFKLPIATTTAVAVYDMAGNNILKSRKFRRYGEVACEFIDAQVKEKQTIMIEKYASIRTGRDSDAVVYDASHDLRQALERGFDNEFEMHQAEYKRLWTRADLVIKGDDKLQHALRFNIFQLMSTPSMDDDRTNIGAKLMHGEEYGGHAFWDTELFILPFFTYVFPGVAKNLVTYRHNLIDKARENAKLNGYAGAKYPWESADTGDEECPAWTVEPDGSCYRCYVADYEHHVTAAVAFGVDRYYRFTKDEAFLKEKGLEIIVETARFWISRLEYSATKDHYEINQVTGPDEWHEPVDNNAYTNHLAKWNIRKALEYLTRYKQDESQVYYALLKKIQMTESEYEQWYAISEKIYLNNTSGLIEQFEGYFDLKHAIIHEWDANNMPLLPDALKGIKRSQTCILKQADVVMLMFLLENEFDKETQKVNYEYYEQRTLHRSSLSPSIHCMMGLRVGKEQHAYDYLERSAYVDLYDNQGNTREGIHAASTGGTWQSVTLGYGGMSVDREGILTFNPRLPKHWDYIEFSIIWEQVPLHIRITHEDVIIKAESIDKKITYKVNEKTYKI